MAPSSHHGSAAGAGAEADGADAALLARVGAHDAFFCQMVDLVPPELYLPKDDEAAAAEAAHAKYYKVCVGMAGYGWMWMRWLDGWLCWMYGWAGW